MGSRTLSATYTDSYRVLSLYIPLDETQFGWVSIDGEWTSTHVLWVW